MFLLLLLSSLTSCLCGLQLNVTQNLYEAEEEQSLILVWTFRPKPDPSLKDLSVHCDVWTINEKQSDLLLLYDGVEIPRKDEEFSGRVQCDKDLLREGRIRLHVSSLRTQDSGEYTCEVKTDSGVRLEKCGLSVSAAVGNPEPQRSPQRTEPGTQSQRGTGHCFKMSLSAVLFCVFTFYSFTENSSSPEFF